MQSEPSSNNRLIFQIIGLLAIFVTSALAQNEAPSFRRVSVTGAGLNADAALKNAFMIAVEQTVGTLVDAQTMVGRNDQIHEQIIAASNGFIKSYQVVKQWNESGLQHCRIVAQVEIRQLREKLEAAHIPTISVNGPNLAARIYTQDAAEKGAAQLLTKHLDGFPDRVVRVAPGVATPGSSDKAGITRLKIPVTLWVDQQAYTKATVEIKAVLDRFALSKLSQPLSLPRTQYKENRGLGFLAGPGTTLLPMVFFSFRSDQDYGKGSLSAFRALTRATEAKAKEAGEDAANFWVFDITPTGNITLHSYIIPKSALREFPETADYQNNAAIALRISLRDAQGAEIANVEHRFKVEDLPDTECIMRKANRDDSTHGQVLWLVPGIWRPRGSDLCLYTMWQGVLSAELETASVPRLKEIKLSVTWGKERRDKTP